MLGREIIAVCSQIHTKHINTLCGQNVELLNVKLAVHIVTTGLWAECTIILARSQNSERQLLASSCQSIHPHGTTRLPMDGYF